MICSDIGGMSEKVTDGVNGLHFRRRPRGPRRGDADAAETPGLWDELRAGIPPVSDIARPRRGACADIYRSACWPDVAVHRAGNGVGNAERRVPQCLTAAATGSRTDVLLLVVRAEPNEPGAVQLDPATASELPLAVERDGADRESLLLVVLFPERGGDGRRLGVAVDRVRTTARSG